MRHAKLIGLAILATVVLSASVSAQKKPATKKPAAKKPATTAKTTTIVPPLDVRAAREKVDVQLDNLNAFLDKYVGLAESMEAADADARGGRLSPASVAKVEDAKAKLVQSIRDLKTGIANLESEFRTKPALSKYLPTIQGLTDLAAEAEDSAVAGKFVAAKDPLRTASLKLLDTLAVLPK